VSEKTKIKISNTVLSKMLLKFRVVTETVNLYTIKHGILSKAKKDLIKSLETLKTEIQF
jgi:hypothetical protein